MSETAARRHSYNAIAAQYDRARPGYPAALFDDIAAYAQLKRNGRIFENGCGAGQATLPLAQRGFAIDCVELGADLAAVARAKLRSYPNVQVEQADFDSMALPPATYDLVLSATAFHWLNPLTRFERARAILKPAGALALCWHRPVLTAAVDQGSFAALQRVYRRIVPQMALANPPPPHPDDATTEYEEIITAGGLFHQLKIQKHYVETKYNAASYIDLLGTFSDHRALDADTRRRLLDDIADLIECDFAGSIVRETVALLYLARRA